MRLALPFGKSVREIELPDANVVKVLRARHGIALPDPAGAVSRALAEPIGCRPMADLASGHDQAVVVICDMTRPVPNQIILPPILRALEDAGLTPDRITILVATGLHRPNQGAEVEAMVGGHIARS